MNREELLKSLIDKVIKTSEDYYNGNPTISDEEFDATLELLRRIDPNCELLDKVGFGHTPVSTDVNKTLPHRYETSKFENKVRDSAYINIPKDKRVTTVKLDGGSVMMYYTSGKLDYAITRGDGVNGFDVTSKLELIAPSLLIDDTFTGMVRGEIVISTDTFERKYSDSASSRNTAIGILKRSNTDIETVRDLRFVAYTVRGLSSSPLDNKTSVMNWLAVNNFEVADELDVSDWSNEGLAKSVKSYKKYLIDGLVVTSENYDLTEDGSYVPSAELAYKIESDYVKVVVESVIWSYTRTGNLVPRVTFEPVTLSGASISKATAFNYRFVKENGLGKGAVITIQRSGEIIPDIVSVDSKVSPSYPENCNYCGESLSVEGVHLACKNTSCSGKSRNDVLHWISVVAPIKGLGGTIVNNFLDYYDINSVKVLYTKLDLDELTNIDKVSTATSKLLLDMIDKLNRPIELDKFLIANNLKGLGGSSAKALAESVPNLMEMSPAELVNLDVKGLNRTAKTNLLDNFDKLQEHCKLVQLVEVVKTEEVVKLGCFAVTGKLSVPRKTLVSSYSELGWVESSIEKADYLVTNDTTSNSSKLVKARKLGVELITESDFNKLIGLDKS